MYHVSALVLSLKAQKQPAVISWYVECGSIFSIVLYNVPNLSPHTQSWILRHHMPVYKTKRSAVSILFSQIFSLFPREVQPHLGYCHLCSFVDLRESHCTSHNISLQNVTWLSLPVSLLLATQLLDSSFWPPHLTGLSSAPTHPHPVLVCLAPSPSGISISPISLFPSAEKFGSFLVYIPLRAHQQGPSRYQGPFSLATGR